jgi:uncharacterized protein YjbJ (UPF0337 family)
MNKFMWILGAACLGVAAYVLLNGQQGAGMTTGDAADELGARAGNWGTKNRVKGTGGVLGGKLEQGLGSLTDDKAVKGKGALDEAVGHVKDAAGKAANAVSDAVADHKS